MHNSNHHRNTYKANVLLLLQSRIVTHKLYAISIDIATGLNFRYMELMDALIWISKNVSLCWVFTHQVTYMVWISTMSNVTYCY